MQRKGFTVMELCVVLIILAIFATIMIPVYKADYKVDKGETVATEVDKVAVPGSSIIKLGDGIWDINGMRFIKAGRGFPLRYKDFVAKNGSNFDRLPESTEPGENYPTNHITGYWMIPTDSSTPRPMMPVEKVEKVK